MTLSFPRHPANQLILSGFWWSYQIEPPRYFLIVKIAWKEHFFHNRAGSPSNVLTLTTVTTWSLPPMNTCSTKSTIHAFPAPKELVDPPFEGSHIIALRKNREGSSLHVRKRNARTTPSFMMRVTLINLFILYYQNTVIGGLKLGTH
ncbi:hypothetical protein evm_002227 [Chilo suppressalis]|nr:hypothetical protein evm_002227 [Chilo suppressalis]